MASFTRSQDCIQLTSAQALALTSAASRSDGAVVVADRLKGKSAQTFVEALIGKGLAREIRAKAAMPVHRRDAALGRSYALMITKLGRTAIASLPSKIMPSDVGTATVWSPRTAPSSTPSVADRAASTAPVVQPSGSEIEVPGSGGVSQAAHAESGSPPRPGSKMAVIIALLSREGGASVEDLMAATGWLPHTTRAALTGLRKRGFAIVRERPDGKGTVYRIASTPRAEAA